MTVKQAYEIIFGKTNNFVDETYVRENVDQVKLRNFHHKLMQTYHPDTSKFAKEYKEIISDISKEINIANDILKKCLLDKNYIHKGKKENLVYDNFYEIIKKEEVKKAKIYRKRLIKAINTYKYYTTISIINNIKTFYEKIENTEDLEQIYHLIFEYQKLEQELVSNLEKKDNLYKKYYRQSSEAALDEKTIIEVSEPYYETLDNQEIQQIIEENFQEQLEESNINIVKIENLIEQQEKRYIDNLTDLKDAYTLLKNQELEEAITNTYNYFKNINKNLKLSDIIVLEEQLIFIKSIKQKIDYCKNVYDDLIFQFLFKGKNKMFISNMETFYKFMNMIFPEEETTFLKPCQELIRDFEELKKRKESINQRLPRINKQNKTILSFLSEYKDNLIKEIEANYYLYCVLYKDRNNTKLTLPKEFELIYLDRKNQKIDELINLKEYINQELIKEVEIIKTDISTNNRKI